MPDYITSWPQCQPPDTALRWMLAAAIALCVVSWAADVWHRWRVRHWE